MFRIRKVEAILTGAGCKSLLQPALYAPRPVPSNEGLCIEPPRTRTGDPQLRRRSEAFSQRRSCSSTLAHVHVSKGDSLAGFACPRSRSARFFRQLVLNMVPRKEPQGEKLRAANEHMNQLRPSVMRGHKFRHADHFFALPL
jgi:hypothetical protein